MKSTYFGLFKGGTPPLTTNWALSTNGTTATSSDAPFGGSSATNTNDGIRHTSGNWNGGAGAGYSSTNIPSVGSPITLTYDFGTTRNVGQVNFFSLSDAVNYSTDPTTSETNTSFAPIDFTIDYWNGSAWVTVVTVTGNDKTRRDMPFPVVSTTKVRLSCTQGRSSRLFAVELEAMGY